MIRLFSRFSLTIRVMFLTSFWAAVILVSIISYSYFASKKILLNEVHQRNFQLCKMIAERIQNEVLWVERSVKRTAVHLFSMPLTRDNFIKTHGDALDNQRNAFGGLLIFTPESKTNHEYKNLYLFRSNQNKKYTAIDRDANIDYTADWYILPYYAKKPIWSEPYFDSEAQEYMVTYSYPIIHSNADSTVEAILTADISLNWLEELILNNNQTQGDICLMSNQALFIVHPNKSYKMNESFFSVAELDIGSDDPKVLEAFNNIGYEILKKNSGVSTLFRPKTKEKCLIFFETVPACGWKVCVIIKEGIVMSEIDTMLKISVILAVLGSIFFMLASFKLATLFARPISVLSDIADVIATGKFDIPIPKFDTCREMDNLASSFRKMVQDLRKHIAYLTLATSQKEKIASELAIARDIQMGLVPKLTPPYPIHSKVDLYAKLVPALEVGGDFYDFMFLDSETLYIAIADVSGKGIAAALMMAVTRTHLRSAITSFKNPAKALFVTNNEIAETNDACMFVTTFVAIINIKTGSVTYSNAGHNPPLIYRKETNTTEWLKTDTKPPIGPFKNIHYKNEEIHLGINDTLLLYTDGITEAMTPRSEMYSEERLERFSLKNHNMSAQNFLNSLYDDIKFFSKGAAQYDDMTTLLIKILPTKRNTMPLEIPPLLESLTLSKKLTDLNLLVAWLEEIAEKHNLPMSITMKLNLVLEEWFINLISYAFPDGDRHSINIGFTRDGDKVYIQIIDDGVAYDPTAEVDNEYHKPLEERRIGGLGIHFIKESMDLFHYARCNKKNINTLMTTISNCQ